MEPTAVGRTHTGLYIVSKGCLRHSAHNSHESYGQHV